MKPVKNLLSKRNSSIIEKILFQTKKYIEIINMKWLNERGESGTPLKQKNFHLNKICFNVLDFFYMTPLDNVVYLIGWIYKVNKYEVIWLYYSKVRS